MVPRHPASRCHLPTQIGVGHRAQAGQERIDKGERGQRQKHAAPKH